MRACRRACGALVFAVFLAAAGPAFADNCPDAGEGAAVVAAVAPRGELKLADGRVLRLAGFDPALATPGNLDLGDLSRKGLADRVVGKAVKLRILSRAADRWGRRPAHVFLDDGSATSGGIAVSAVAAGLGRYLAEPAAHGCRDQLLRAEATARRAKLGLWADPYYGVLAVDDRAGFAERAGTIVLAEGSVAAVQPGPFRTTLRFTAPTQGSQGSRGMLVATIVPRVSKMFQAQQVQAQRVDIARLVGRRLRLRGLLDLRFGPRIELNGPDDIEMIDQPGPGTGPGASAAGSK